VQRVRPARRRARFGSSQPPCRQISSVAAEPQRRKEAPPGRRARWRPSSTCGRAACSDAAASARAPRPAGRSRPPAEEGAGAPRRSAQQSEHSCPAADASALSKHRSAWTYASATRVSAESNCTASYVRSPCVPADDAARPRTWLRSPTGTEGRPGRASRRRRPAPGRSRPRWAGRRCGFCGRSVAGTSTRAIAETTWRTRDGGCRHRPHDVELDQGREVAADRQRRPSATRPVTDVQRPAAARARSTSASAGRATRLGSTASSRPAAASRPRTRCASSPARGGSVAADSTPVTQSLRLRPCCCA
jgi:hypothetical protein